MVIVLNDNKMSIAPNVGGMSTYLGKIRANRKYRDLKMNVENSLDKIPNVGHPLARQIKRAKDSIKHLFIPGMLFEDMGLIYIGPVNGHNVNEMVTAFETAFSITNQPVLVHVLTQKGKGYKPAEQNPSAFHGVGTFDVKDGTILKTNEVTYTNIFSDWLLSRGAQCNELVSVCAAMPDGTGTAAFAKTFPSRAFDVGIAEEHAVTFAAGLAAGGMRPVVSLYSTFLQRAYDQMIHDERMNIINRLVNELPEKQRLIKQMRDIEGESYKKIAGLLNLTEEQVKVNLFRARQKVKQRYLEIDEYGL